jgi:hypothetical protein
MAYHGSTKRGKEKRTDTHVHGGTKIPEQPTFEGVEHSGMTLADVAA